MAPSAGRMKELSEIHQEEVRKMLARFQAQRQEISMSLPPVVQTWRSPVKSSKMVVEARVGNGIDKHPEPASETASQTSNSEHRDDFATMRRERDRSPSTFHRCFLCRIVADTNPPASPPVGSLKRRACSRLNCEDSGATAVLQAIHLHGRVLRLAENQAKMVPRQLILARRQYLAQVTHLWPSISQQQGECATIRPFRSRALRRWLQPSGASKRLQVDL